MENVKLTQKKFKKFPKKYFPKIYLYIKKKIQEKFCKIGWGKTLIQPIFGQKKLGRKKFENFQVGGVKI